MTALLTENRKIISAEPLLLAAQTDSKPLNGSLLFRLPSDGGAGPVDTSLRNREAPTEPAGEMLSPKVTEEEKSREMRQEDISPSVFLL